MKRGFSSLGLLSFSLLLFTAMAALGQGTAFTYQGRLTDGPSPAAGIYEMQFKLFDTVGAGTGVQKGATLVNSAVPVANGVFTVTLDFGATVFDGSARFMEVAVRPMGSAVPHSVLAPRQPVTPTPYAIHSLAAATASAVGTGAAVKSINNLKDEVTLTGGANVSITSSGNTLTIASVGTGPGAGPWSLSGTNVFYESGNIGIGTSQPRVALEVDGTTLVTPGGLGGVIQFGTPSFETGMTIVGANRADIRFDGASLKLLAGSGTGIPAPGNGLAINASGNVGVGTVNPVAKLHVAGGLQYDGRMNKLDVDSSFAAVVRAGDFLLGHPERRGEPGRALVDFNTDLHLNFAGDWGNTVIGGTTTVIQGDASVRALTIRGGADLAEPFVMKGKVDTGLVMVIDEEHPGELKISTEPYDTRVAGVVSGANGIKPGIALYQEGMLEGGQNVALSGRVYVQADATFGAIKPGDLLTTSSTAGHAMKATDRVKAQGAVLGKAMTALPEGKGLVLVLVTLQ